DALAREVVRKNQKRMMSGDGFVTIVRARSAEKHYGGERAGAGRNRERSGERNFRFVIREGHLFLAIGIGLGRSLRTAEFEDLIGALEIQCALDATLLQASRDGRLCSVERAVIDSVH